MKIFDILMPLHEVVILVQEKEECVSQEEDRILVGEDVRVRSGFALAHMLVKDAPEKQSGVKNMDRDKDRANRYFALSRVVTSCKAYHNS